MPTIQIFFLILKNSIIIIIMKILFYSWNSNNETSFIDGLKEEGHEVVVYSKECVHYTRDMNLASDMIPFVHANHIEAVASFNYFPIISLICNTVSIPYYSWVYDCPHLTLNACSVKLPCNHIGVFDKDMANYYNSLGVNTVFHLPLAVRPSDFQNTITKTANKKRFSCDVSFVGSLYTGKHDYFENLKVSSQNKEKTLSLLEEYIFNYHNYSPDSLINQSNNAPCISYTSLDNCASDTPNASTLSSQTSELSEVYSITEAWISAMEEQGLMLGEDYFFQKEELVLSSIFETKMTTEERHILLTEVAKKLGTRFHLHTNSDLSSSKELRKCSCGIVNYHTEMPLVFNQSRINLNISLRSIHSGIPLRVLDIMACGGFVLSNYQPELAELFVPDSEIVLFDSLEDALEKIDYYLSHEDERMRIANAGLKAVSERFSYKEGINKLMHS